MSEPVYLQREGALGALVLNRPDKKNALTLSMWQAIPRLLDTAESDAALRVLILRGADGRSFASGSDIGELGQVYASAASARNYDRALERAQRRLAEVALPTVALIQGPCMGGGSGLALACDLRFADETARFAIPPARLGLVFSAAGTRRLVEAVGASAARDLLYSARTVSAEEALRIRLVDRLFPAGDLLRETHAYAERIAALSPGSLRAAKRMVRLILDGAADDSPEALALFSAAHQSGDFHEGRAAFLERRPPRFSGD